MTSITCGNIRFSEEDVKELDGGQVLVSIKRSDIQSITVCYGQSSEKPVVQVAIGIFTLLIGCSIGLWPLIGYIVNLGTRSGGHIAPIAFAVPLILIGVYIILPVFRRCYYLLIITSGLEKRKLPLDGCAVRDVVEACQALGYSVMYGYNFYNDNKAID
jgi:hypothetical protein